MRQVNKLMSLIRREPSDNREKKFARIRMRSDERDKHLIPKLKSKNLLGLTYLPGLACRYVKRNPKQMVSTQLFCLFAKVI